MTCSTCSVLRSQIDHRDNLLARAVRCAGHGAHGPQLPRWSHVGAIFALGSGSAREMCRRYGVDPDELVGSGVDVATMDPPSEEPSRCGAPLHGGEPPGTPVIAIEDDGTEIHTWTRSWSWRTVGGDRAVLLHGCEGRYSTDQCVVDPSRNPRKVEST